MQTHTFQAKEIKEALALVRRDLGPDAVVVGTRRVPGRAMGLLGGNDGAGEGPWKRCRGRVGLGQMGFGIAF